MDDKSKMDPNEREARDRFAHLGAEQVKLLQSTGGLPQAWSLYAAHWLAEQDSEAGREPAKVDDVKPQSDTSG